MRRTDHSTCRLPLRATDGMPREPFSSRMPPACSVASMGLTYVVTGWLGLRSEDVLVHLDVPVANLDQVGALFDDHQTADAE
jgi:hypothetical protein